MTTILARNVHKSVTAKELATFLGLSPDTSITLFSDTAPSETSTATFQINVISLDDAMAIFKKHNFTELKKHFVSLEFFPAQVYNTIPEIQVELPSFVRPEKIYKRFLRFGTVISVIQRRGERSDINISMISYTTKEGAKQAQFTVVREFGKKKKDSHLRISGHFPRFVNLKNCFLNAPDFWTPPKVPEKAKGNLIDVPMNVTDPKRSITQVAHVVPGNNLNNSLNNHHRNNGNPSARPRKTLSISEQQRSVHFSKSIVRIPHTFHPGEIRSKSLPSYLYRAGERTEGFESNRSEWCDTAFLCYETLYSLSSKSPQGLVSISTLAWGSQLDISTFRLHYGSIFTPSGSRRAYPVASCLTVEMRQYGDKDSAAEVLGIRNNGHLTESFDTLAEGMNVTGRGNIMAMKCLESGHLVTSSTTTNGGSTLHVWDMRDNLEQAKIPVALLNSEPWPKIWFDARGMDVCSVDRNGAISGYDLYKTVSSNSHTSTTGVDRSVMTDIDTEYPFYSTCISINGFDSTVLVGSGEHAQIAHWDPRSPSLAARTTTACRVKDATTVQRRFFDPVYDIEWNPNNSNEFMSVHVSTIRVWDVRKMDHDAYATFHHMGMAIRKARWSPHHSDCVAGLTMEGTVKIWKIKKFEGPVNVTTPRQHPDELFLHRAQDRGVSDFAWNPYVEDVISTVCPGTETDPGSIQVWRPRNLHDSDENGEP